jgi:hypothetical protein
MRMGVAFVERWSAALRAVPFVYAALGATILAAGEPITLDCGDELYFKVSYEESTISQRNPDGSWAPELPAKITPVSIAWETKPDGDFPAIATMIDRQTGRRSWHETSGTGKSGNSTCRLTTLAPKF